MAISKWASKLETDVGIEKVDKIEHVEGIRKRVNGALF